MLVKLSDLPRIINILIVKSIRGVFLWYPTRPTTSLIKSKIKSEEYYDRRINKENFKMADLKEFNERIQWREISNEYTGLHTVPNIFKYHNVKIEVKGMP